MTDRPTRRLLAALTLGAAVVAVALPSPTAHADTSTDLSRTLLLSSDDGLRAQGMDYAVQQIDFFGRDGGHDSIRWFQQEFRWVRGDERRGATGPGLSVLVDDSWTGDGASTLDPQTLRSAVARAAATWRADSCLAKSPLRETEPPGGDVTVFDYLLGTGGFGDPFAADVVVAGPAAGMEEIFDGDVLAFAVTFVFVGADGTPTDADADGHLDTALSEIYLNPAVDWTLDGASGIDLETALLHEIGHALGLGHFGSPPASVMTPIYSGLRRALLPIDHAALCLLYPRK